MNGAAMCGPWAERLMMTTLARAARERGRMLLFRGPRPHMRGHGVAPGGVRRTHEKTPFGPRFGRLQLQSISDSQQSDRQPSATVPSSGIWQIKNAEADLVHRRDGHAILVQRLYSRAKSTRCSSGAESGGPIARASGDCIAHGRWSIARASLIKRHCGRM